MDPQLLFATAVTPSLLLLWFFHARDHHPEPRSVLLATFFLGVVIVIPVLAIAAPFERFGAAIGDPYLRGVYRAFAVAAIPEELCKLAVVWFYCARHKAFDEPMDGLVYGAIASLGFATLENLLYVAQGGTSVALLRAFTAVPSHAFWGVIMGYYVGQARFGPPERRARRLWAAFVVPMLLHGLYDAPVLALKQASELAAKTRAAIPDLAVAVLVLSLLTLIVSGVWAVRAAGGLRRDQLAAAAIVVTSAPGVSVTAAVVTARAPARSLFAGIALLLVGGLMVCGGGFLLLGVVLVASGAGDRPVEPAAIGVAAGVALVPLVLGALAFRAGLRRL